MANLIRELLSSPSTRASTRRLAFIVVVFSGTFVGTYAGLREMDVKSGTLALFSALLAATGTAVTVGRFAERGTEAPPPVDQDIEERRRK